MHSTNKDLEDEREEGGRSRGEKGGRRERGRREDGERERDDRGWRKREMMSVIVIYN